MKYFIYFVAIMNVATFFAFALDKYKAARGRWRIPEKTLILLGFAFGSVGQLCGMKVFRHKTLKWYFWLSGTVSLLLQIGIIWILCTKI